MKQFFNLSIDLDPLWCYRHIFGLPPGPREDPLLARAAERFQILLDMLEIPATVFVVGESLSDPRLVKALHAQLAAGCEIGNHTYSHPYDLSLQSGPQIADEIERGAAACHKSLGLRPQGFRAPGYALGSQVLSAVAAAGCSYDSSILPSPAYQGAKALARHWLKRQGRPSGAILADPRESLGPRLPYRPDLRAPWRHGSASLLELPISSILGLPLTGSLLAFAGPARVGLLARAAAAKAFVCLELHAVDLLDISADGIDPALGVQRDLHIPWERKLEATAAFVEGLLPSHQAATLADIAKQI